MELKLSKQNVKFLRGVTEVSDLRKWKSETPEIIGMAMVGRSNVGKSSLINSFFGKSVAKTSKTPGRTRQINIFSYELEADVRIKTNPRHLYLFDLPGYGHASVSKEERNIWDNLIKEFFEIVIDQKVAILMLQDSRHPNQKSDQDFQNFVLNYDVETYLIFNKMDKLKTQKERAELNKKKIDLFKEYKHVKQIHFISSLKGTGLKELESSLISYFFASGVEVLV